MADKRDDQKAEESYELDLDETLSDWEQVAQEAVEAVESKGEEPAAEGDIRAGLGNGGRGTGDAEGDDDIEDLWVASDKQDEAGESLEDKRTKDLYDKLVRTLADFDNFRKRTEREKEKIHRYALFDVLKDFLSVFDNLERALAASGSAEDLKTGVQMIARQFADLLGRYGVEAVEAVDKPFDPTVHEAVLREEKEEVEEPTVVSELQRGYKLHDRLLRPAMVSVAVPSAKSGDEPRAADEAVPEPEAVSEEGGADEDARAAGDDEALDRTLGQATEVN